VETKKNKQGVGVMSQESVVAASMHQRWEGLSIKKGPKTMKPQTVKTPSLLWCYFSLRGRGENERKGIAEEHV